MSIIKAKEKNEWKEEKEWKISNKRYKQEEKEDIDKRKKILNER